MNIKLCLLRFKKKLNKQKTFGQNWSLPPISHSLYFFLSPEKKKLDLGNAQG